MKSFSVLHILLLLLFVIVYQCAKAQDYVVTTKGDTITGQLKPLTYGPEKKVQVVAEDKKKTTYSIFQLKAYQYKGETFQPVKTATGYSFMKLLKSGYLSLYAFQQENQVSYDGLYLVKKDGASMEVPNLSFKKMMERFLEDCSDVTAKIDAGELGKKDINQIVDEYNNCIQARTIDHSKIIVQNKEQTRKAEPWDVLEQKVKAKSEFQGKDDAVEMITEIRNKIRRGEKVPNFMIEGLKSSLQGTDLSSDLENALAELNK